MEKMKKIIKKLFFMPLMPVLFISIPSFALVFYVLAKGEVSPMIAYFSYILSAYAMVITLIKTVEIVKWIRGGIGTHPFARRILGIPLVERYFSEKDFRVEVSLYPSFAINLFYAGIKFISGFLYHSVWFGTLAAYYILLAVMRFSLLRHVRKNSGFEYPGMLIYAMAFYTFYAVITAVVNVVKFRKHKNPALSVIKVINLTAALVSLLSLETAMLTQFGAADDASFRQTMSAATGAGVSILVLAMAVYIIERTTNQIKKEEEWHD